MNQQSIPTAGRERLSLDAGWRFHLGDIPFPVIRGHGDSYGSAKAGKAWGAAAPEYDDSTWRVVNLPHDWAVEGPFDPEENLAQGYRPRGLGWYRRQFTLPASDRGRHLELHMDGVATHCTVWFNGSVVHRNWCGYTSFYVDLTSFATYGDEVNTIAVRVDANAMEGWWYEGAGIYRHTWLVKRPATHIATDGVFAQPVRGAGGGWTVPVEVTVAHAGTAAARAAVEVVLLDPAGRPVAKRRATAKVEPLDQAVVRLTIPVKSPRLWSVDKPVLYRVQTRLLGRGQGVDEVITRCGFRTFRFDAKRGFFLNGRALKIKGVCNHQDHAGVGVAVPDALWAFRLGKLKEMGVNAYRCSHNPPSVELLDQCDELGLLVMDENRHFNSSPEYMRQLEWLVRRDRNHPSVFMWSVFNEEPMQGTEVGYEMVRRMSALVKRLDTTRPVTAAMNGGLFAPVNVSQAVDVVGFNYQIRYYDRFHDANPRLPLTSSEDTSAFMTRGVYENDLPRNRIEAYDTQAAPWGATHRDAWKNIAERSFLAGGFVWTGFDYRGEPTPLSWPSASSFFGCLDLCGFPKTAFYIHQAQWVTDRPVLHLVPHWNWPGREGQPVTVMVISNADKVKLLLNGKSLGEKRVDPFAMVTWQVPYAPGRLEAVAKTGGRVVARTLVETTGDPVALQLLPDRPGLAGDGHDAMPITVQAVDAVGRPVPTSNLPVDFAMGGPGALVGLGNGDTNCHEAEKGTRRSLFNGLAQVIVQAGLGSGELILQASAWGLKPAEVVLPVRPVAAPPSVPVFSPALILRDWRMSPVTAARPDPNVQVGDNDMNSWVSVQPGEVQDFVGGRWAIYRSTFSPFAAVQEQGGQLVFKGLSGRAEIWLDQQQVAQKDSFEEAPLAVPVPPGLGTRTVSVLVESRPGVAAGLSGLITVG